jgi:hypothetical protein
MTAYRFGKINGRTPGTVNRWTTSDDVSGRAIPPEAVILLKLLMTGKVTVADIESLD